MRRSCPKAALIGKGMTDLSFVSETLAAAAREDGRDRRPAGARIRRRCRDHVVHADTTPLEIVLLLHQGENNVPVVDRAGGRLIGMVSARELLDRAPARRSD